MLNHKNNVHKAQKSKSKIFITILCIFGLLFSWSCSCKNRVSDPNETPINGGITNKKPDETPPGTFSMSASTNNVVTSIVKSSTTSISEIKIAFTEANNHDYTMDYTVEDSETDEAKKLTKADFQLANKVLTAKDSVAKKVNLVDSSAGPVEKTITINFTFKANDATLKNNTQTLSVEVKLTKAQEVKDDNIENILKKMGGGTETIELDDGTPSQSNVVKASFPLHGGSYSAGEYVIKNQTTSNPITSFTKEHVDRMNEYVDYYLPALDEIKTATRGNIEGGENSSFYTITYSVEFADSYESSLTEVKIKFVSKK